MDMEQLLTNYPALEACRESIEKTYAILEGSFENGGKLLLCGNGGSAADCEHIVGELMKSFLLKRPMTGDMALRFASFGEDGAALFQKLERGLPAISLCGHSSLSTAFGNDKDASMTFAQQVFGYGRAGDVLLALSTSGNSKNCVYAAETAKALGLKVVSITGEGGGRLSRLSDVCIALPETETFRVQELTLPVYHWLCAALEKRFFA